MATHQRLKLNAKILNKKEKEFLSFSFFLFLAIYSVANLFFSSIIIVMSFPKCVF